MQAVPGSARNRPAVPAPVKSAPVKPVVRSRGLIPRPTTNAAIETALSSLGAEAPSLVPVFDALCDAPDFPQHGQPAERLKSFLRNRGLSERAWRMIAHSDGRLLEPLQRFYCGPIETAALEQLRLLDLLQLNQQPPAWFIDQLIAAWGDPDNLWHSYVDEIGPAIENWRHVAALISRMRETAQTLDEFDLVRWFVKSQGWALVLDKMQRRAGWKWLVRSAQRWEEHRRRLLQADPRPWPVPFDSIAIGEWEFVALSNELELLDEARAMHHCADTYGPQCRCGGYQLVSMRREGLRIATVEIRKRSGVWYLLQAKGIGNSRVCAEVLEAVTGFVDQLPVNEPPVKEQPPTPVRWDTPSMDRLDANPATSELSLSDGHGQDGMQGEWFDRRIEACLNRLWQEARSRNETWR